MTAPVDVALAAFAARLGALLVASGFLAAPEDLKDEPDEPFGADGEPGGLRSACSFFRLGVVTHRTYLGGALPRYVLDQGVQIIAVAAFGTSAERDQALGKVLDAAALITAETETLSGTVERVLAADGDGPARETISTAKTGLVITLQLRLSAADALGRT